MIGLSLAMLPADDFKQACDLFVRLRERYPLATCEVSAETVDSAAALQPWDRAALESARPLRSIVRMLGLHLPYRDLNPVAGHPRIARASRDALLEGLDAAAGIGADYAVLHVRGGDPQMSGEAQIAAWRPVLDELSGHATARGVRLLLENADDMRRLPLILELAAATGVDVCLDTGHLFERLYETPEWGALQRLAARWQDIVSPQPFRLTARLPAAESGGLSGAMAVVGDRLGCLHLHDHDGRGAHCPLDRGKTPWRELAASASRLRGIPVILEADYRHHGRDLLECDLRTLAGMLGEEGPT